MRKDRYTAILEFKVIKSKNSQNHFWKKGEILKLSNFGEYCPNRSLRGYQLQFLLINPEYFRPYTIIQKGKILNIFDVKPLPPYIMKKIINNIFTGHSMFEYQIVDRNLSITQIFQKNLDWDECIIVVSAIEKNNYDKIIIPFIEKP